MEKIYLIIPKSEVENKLKERIAKGKELINSFTQVNNEKNFETFESKVANWRDYNCEYLTQAFSNDDLSFESHANIGSYSRYDAPLYIRQQELLDRMNGYISKLESILERVEIIPEHENIKTNKIDSHSTISKNIFVVHGHDRIILNKIKSFLELINHPPIILDEQVNSSKTIIEKIESYSNVGYAIVIMSPDDLGIAKKDLNLIPEDQPESRLKALENRARQNVVLELGFFMGKLGRENIAILYPEKLEIMTDIHGVLYIPITEDNSWQVKLKSEIDHAFKKL